METTFKSIIELINTFDSEQKCIDFLEDKRWNGNVVSPFDSKSKVYRLANNWYKCKSTGRFFNVKTGTLFSESKLPLQKWFTAIYLIVTSKKGISSCQLAIQLNVTQKTAWFVSQRIRKCLGAENESILSKKVEVDEVSEEGFNRYFELTTPVLEREGITDGAGYYTTDWLGIKGDVRRELVGIILSKIIPSEMRA